MSHKNHNRTLPECNPLFEFNKCPDVLTIVHIEVEHVLLIEISTHDGDRLSERTGHTNRDELKTL